MTAMERPSLVRLEGMTKRYRGVPAVKNVTFELREGEAHAPRGGNGAGKSTLTKMIAGVVPPSEGTITYRGKAVTFECPHQALEAGIAMLFQETSLVPSMRVAQNISLGAERFLNRLRGVIIEAQQFLQLLNFLVDPKFQVS